MYILLVHRQLHRDAVYRTHLVGPDISRYPDINSDLFVIFLKYILYMQYTGATALILY